MKPSYIIGGVVVLAVLGGGALLVTSLLRQHAFHASLQSALDRVGSDIARSREAGDARVNEETKNAEESASTFQDISLTVEKTIATLIL